MSSFEVYKTNDDGSPDDLVSGFDDRDNAIREAKDYPLNGKEYAYVKDGAGNVIFRTDGLLDEKVPD